MAENDQGVTLQEIFLRFSPLYEDYVIVVYFVAGAVVFLAEWANLVQVAAFVLLAVMGFYSFFAYKDRALNKNDVWAKLLIGSSIASAVLLVGFLTAIFPALTLRALVAVAFLTNAGVHYALDGDIELSNVATQKLKIPQVNLKFSGKVFNFRNYVWAVTIAMVIYTLSGVNTLAQTLRTLVGFKIDPYLIGPALLVIGLILTRNGPRRSEAGKKEEKAPVRKARSKKPQKEEKDG